MMKEMMLEGVAGIVEGLNPKLIRTKLEAFTGEQKSAPGPAAAGDPPAAKGDSVAA
jgi:flagellar motor component MotA